jgi:hypothetical protein
VVAFIGDRRTGARPFTESGGVFMRWLSRHSPAIQATGSILAVLIASIATVIAAKTLGDQTELNRLSQDRFERRHASRVAWWYERDYQFDLYAEENRARVERAPAKSIVDYETITLVNRSPVSITLIEFAIGKPGVPATAWWLVPDLRPCESIRVRLRTERDNAIRYIKEGKEYYSNLYFADPAVTFWQNGAGGLLKDDANLRVRDSGSGLLQETKLISRAPTADCGESA